MQLQTVSKNTSTEGLNRLHGYFFVSEHLLDLGYGIYTIKAPFSANQLLEIEVNVVSEEKWGRQFLPLSEAATAHVAVGLPNC